MSFVARSLDAISQGVRGAFRQYMPGTDASLKQNVTYVIAKVVTLLAREYCRGSRLTVDCLHPCSR